MREGEPADWIELVNLGPAPVNLRDWSLTDDPTRPTQWIFDDVTLAPGEQLLVLATGKDRTRIEIDDETGQPGFLHTNFRLGADGGFLALYPPTARRYLDSTSLDYPRQLPGSLLRSQPSAQPARRRLRLSRDAHARQRQCGCDLRRHDRARDL